jgi:uncharacterized protein (TIGR02246 family)
MSLFRRSLPTSAALAAAILLVGTDALAQPNPLSEDEKDCRAIVTAQAEAWNRGDTRALAADFAPDGMFIAREGELCYGRDEFARHHAELFRSVPKDRKKFVGFGMMLGLAPDVMLVDAVHDVTTAGDQPAAEARDHLRPVEYRLHVRYVFRRAEGRWRIAAQQETEVRGGAGAR